MSTTFPPRASEADPVAGPGTDATAASAPGGDPHREQPTPERPGVRFAGLRLAALLGVLAFIGWASPWTLIVIMALVVMIFLHELGHFVMAKRAGMKATEFFIGFGPRIWSFQRGETEYGIKAIPAGAYVKIIGMHNIESVPPEDEARTYRQKSFGQRLGVAVAGSTMHFILAVVLIYVALVGIGQPAGTLDPETQQRAWYIESVLSGSGASEAGLQPGDRIVSIDGASTATFEDLRSVTADLEGETVPVVYVRDGETLETDLTLDPFTTWRVERVAEGGPVDRAGLEPGDQIMSIAGQPISSAITPQDLNAMLEGTEGTTVPVEFERDGEGTRTVELNVDSLALVGAPGRVGISRGLPDDDKVGAAAGLVDAPKEFVNLSVTSLQALGKFFTPGGVSDFAGQVVDARDDRAATVQEDQARSAPVTETSTRMVDDGGGNDGENRLLSIYGLVTIGSDLGEIDPGSLIVLFAMINVFIGLFNLVPLLPFDGGHVAIAVYEKVQEKRLHRRRYFTDVGRLVPFANIVVLALGMLFISTLYLDIANPLVAR